MFFTSTLWIAWLAMVLFLWFYFPIRRDRLLIKYSMLTLAVVVASFFACTFLGTAIDGFRIATIMTDESHGIDFSGKVGQQLWHLYYLFIDAGNQHDYAHTAEGRWFVGIIGFFSLIILNGFLISALMSTFDHHKDRWLNGELRYRHHALRRHIVIIGGNDMVPAIIEEYRRANPKQLFVILTSREVEEFRRELFASLGFESWRIVIYYGDRTAHDDIAALNLAEASRVFILGEESRDDDAESYHDTLNMSCLQSIADCIRTRTEAPLDCHIMFEYQTTFAAFQIANIDKKKLRLRPFNFYEMWSQTCFAGDHLTTEGTPCYYQPLDGAGIGPEEDTFVHLIVVGMSRMGVALAHSAAMLTHYPNFPTRGKRTRITFIDSDAITERDFLKGRYGELFRLTRHRTIDTTAHDYASELVVPWENNLNSSHLGQDIVDIEWEFIKGSVESKHVRDYLVDAAEEKGARTTVAVCFPESNRAVAAAIYLPAEVYENALQVLVYQRRNSILVDEISAGNSRYHNKLRAFGMVADCFNFALTRELDELSGVVNRAYDDYMDKISKEKAEAPAPAPTSASAPAPAPAPAGKTKMAKMWSSYYNVLTLRSKMRSYGLDYRSEEAPAFTPEQLATIYRVEHNRWVVEQLLMGFRPLTLAEQQSCDHTRADFDERKNLLKGCFAHLDICSMDVLERIDPDSVGLDTALIEPLPAALHNYAQKL